MATRAIKPKREGRQLGGNWEALRERAPSILRADQPIGARIVAGVSLLPLTLGAATFALPAIGWSYALGPGWGWFFLALGLAGLTYHAFREQEFQYRRLYGVLGFVFFAVGIVLRLLPYEREIGGLFLPYGFLFFFVATGFMVAFARNETDAFLRTWTLNLLGLAGALSALAGFIGGMLNEGFLLGHGVLHLTLGLIYLTTFLVMQETGSPRGYWAGVGILVLGLLLIGVALVRSFLPSLLYAIGWLEARPPTTFFMPSGLILLYIGIEFLLIGLGVCSDNTLVVLTKRELAAFFYSPIAYIVLFGWTLIGCLAFWQFTNFIVRYYTGGRELPLREPIVAHLIINLIPIFCFVFIVPILTMRLFSEEKRSGSLEMLLTAPVNEVPVVLSKFFAAWRVYLLAWYPWALFLIAMRVEGGEAFEYRPLLTFFIAIAVIGMSFTAMGVFFSSLTKNQIIAAMLTFAGMLFSTSMFFLRQLVGEDSAWHTVMTYLSYIDIWIETGQGTIVPRYLVFQFSMGVFWLFLTVKVLEARKWS